MEPTTLIEGHLPLPRGLVRVGPSFYILTSEGLYTFKEGQEIAQRLRWNLEDLVILEAGTDRLYLGDEAGHWWSVSLADPSNLVDIGINALDATVLEGALYWLDTPQAVRVQLPSGGSSEYCLLPAPTFDFDSAGLVRAAGSGLAIFRRGYTDVAYSDIFVCPEPQVSNPDRPGVAERVAEAEALVIARADASGIFWSDGRSLFGLQQGGVVEKLFTTPDDDRSDGSFVLASDVLVWSYAKDFTGGMFVVARDAARSPRLLGTLSAPEALYFAPSTDRLCYATGRGQRVACLPLAALTGSD